MRSWWLCACAGAVQALNHINIVREFSLAGGELLQRTEYGVRAACEWLGRGGLFFPSYFVSVVFGVVVVFFSIITIITIITATFIIIIKIVIRVTASAAGAAVRFILSAIQFGYYSCGGKKIKRLKA